MIKSNYLKQKPTILLIVLITPRIITFSLIKKTDFHERVTR